MKKTKKLIPYIWLAVVILGISIYVHHNFILEADDDSGAEMILANEIGNGHGILSEDWIYSTEIRVLNTQIVYGFLFHLFDDWQYVRTIGNAIMYILLVLSVGYLCRQLKIKKYFALVATLFVIPVSRDYYVFALQGAYLLPHITISVLLLALYFDFCSSIGKRRNIVGTIAILLSFLAGMGGIRQCVIFSIPLVLACIWMLYLNRSHLSFEKWFKNTYIQYVLYSIALFAAMSIGLLVNKVLLPRYYSFGSFGSDILYTEFNQEKIGTLILGWLCSIGYQYGNKVISLTTILNLLPAVVFIILILVITGILKNNDKYDDMQKIAVLFFLSGVIILSLLFFFTDMVYYPRYLLPVSVFSFLLVAIFLNCKVNKAKLILWIQLMGILYLTACTVINLYGYTKIDQTSETRMVADTLVEQGYYEGYSSSYWRFGNSITEYTSGKIRVWRMQNVTPELVEEKGSVVLKENLMGWLCNRNMHVEVPTGKIFYISNNELREMDKAVILYKSDSVVVYGYDNYDALVQDMDD